MDTDYELMEKLHSIAQEAQDSDREWSDIFKDLEEILEIIEFLREKYPQAPWNDQEPNRFIALIDMIQSWMGLQKSRYGN